MKFASVVLAAGSGTRMASPLPKVLHPVAGESMIARIVSELSALSKVHVVINPQVRTLVQSALAAYPVEFHEQAEPKGTADAIKSVDLASFPEDILVLNGDHPLIRAEEIKSMYDQFLSKKLDLLIATTTLKNPKEFGRVVRDERGELKDIVEAKEASADELKIKEINTGVFFIKKKALLEALEALENQSATKEFYITKLAYYCYSQSSLKSSAYPASYEMAFGVNSPAQLARATESVFLENANFWMNKGNIIVDPKATYIEDGVSMGTSCVIYPGAYLKKGTALGNFCVIETNSYLHAAQLGNGVQIKGFSYIEHATIKDKASIGPFARIRQGTEIEEEVKIGNFVETKKAKFEKGSKASHLSYIGDATVGERSNIGAGTITCNYTAGKTKEKTTIGNDVFIGSGVQLVAPVEVEDGATVGAGATVRQTVKKGSLFFQTPEGKEIENYSPKKKS